jgi:hypothetical protein
MKPIRLLVAWNIFSKGHVISEMPATLAEFLVRGGFAEYVKDDVRSPVREVMRSGRNYVTKKVARA